MGQEAVGGQGMQKNKILKKKISMLRVRSEFHTSAVLHILPQSKTDFGFHL